MTAKNFEIKFDWQKNAPRDAHFNGMGEVRNSIFNHKPFGIEVRNVKCLKVRYIFCFITFNLLKIVTEHIDSNCSLDSKLFFISICSIKFMNR